MRNALLVASSLAFALSAADAAPIPGVHSFTLANGLTVVVIEDHRAPVVIQMVWYRVGSADDPAGQSGLAHFLEHLMFKATDELPEGALSRIVAENGGSDNAFTSGDNTVFFQRIAADRLDLVMGMEADRMVDLAPGAAGVLSERDVVIEERRQVVESDPTAVFTEASTAALYLNHPYGRPIIGWEHEIARLTPEAALAFYDRHYAPNNAVLIVAGDVVADAVLQLAEKHFGAVPASDAALRDRPQEPPHRAARRVEMQDARVSELVLSRSYLAPQRRTGDQSEAAALVMLAGLLGGSQTTSVMARKLILAEALALEVGASYSDTGVDAQSFDLYAVPKPGGSLAETEAALDATIADFIRTGPDPAQLERIKGQIRASEIFVMDDLWTRANRLGAALTSGLTLDDVDAWPRLLQEVTPEHVQQAAQSLFRIENSVTGWLSPAAADLREAAQ